MNRNISEKDRVYLENMLERYRKPDNPYSKQVECVQIVDAFKEAGMDGLVALKLCLKLCFDNLIFQPPKYILKMIKKFGPLETHERLWMILEVVEIRKKAYSLWRVSKVLCESKLQEHPKVAQALIKKLKTNKRLNEITEEFVVYKMKHG